MLGSPDGVVAEAVGQLDLRERLLQEAVLGARVPGPRQLMLVEQREAHRKPAQRARSGRELAWRLPRTAGGVKAGNTSEGPPKRALAVARL